LVLGVGYTEIGAMGAVAKRFPKTHFAIVDVANGDVAGHPKNVLGLLFHEEQVGYLAGYLAGLEAKRLPGKDVVSSVAGEQKPPADAFIASYQAGAPQPAGGGAPGVCCPRRRCAGAPRRSRPPLGGPRPGAPRAAVAVTDTAAAARRSRRRGRGSETGRGAAVSRSPRSADRRRPR